MGRERQSPAASVDAADMARFDRLGTSWWDPRGPMAGLHALNPVRVAYVRTVAGRHFAPADPERPLAGLAVLDIGCGGGILAEALARLGAATIAIDPAPGNIEIARRHAAQGDLAIDYRCTTAEALAADGVAVDLVVASEVVEHVRHVDAFVATVAQLVRPGGLFVGSTLNRTLKSYALAIVGAEYVLRWVARGTHDWAKFVTPAEFARHLRRGGLRPVGARGMSYDPLRRSWRLSDDLDVNYLIAAGKPAVA